MEIHYYKIEKESELGKLAARLLGDMEDADRIADIVADKYGAKEFYTDSTNDAGGIVALEFPTNVIPDPNLWMPMQIADNPNCYVPNVRIKFNAVFSPIPGTPGILSELSPINAFKSMNSVGVTSYFAFTSDA